MPQRKIRRQSNHILFDIFRAGPDGKNCPTIPEEIKSAGSHEAALIKDSKMPAHRFTFYVTAMIGNK
jgi:hypothetical protein